MKDFNLKLIAAAIAVAFMVLFFPEIGKKEEPVTRQSELVVTSREITTEEIAQIRSQVKKETVYVSRTGTKYHRDRYCSNMSNPLTMSIEEALERGREPCSKCY